MKYYDVVIACTVHETYQVEANSPEEAEERWGEDEPVMVRHYSVEDVVSVTETGE